MSNDVALFKNAGLSLANIGKYRANIAKVQATAPVGGGEAILRLDKEGVWRFGQQLTEIEPGSLWAANPLTFGKGFTAWAENAKKPRGTVMKNVMSGEVVHPNDLPDVGDAEWSESVEVEFTCINGEDKGTTVKYMSNSMGGRERWHQLLAHLDHQFDVDPTRLVAVCSLEHDGYFGSSPQYGTRHPETKQPGWIVKPIFRVVRWMEQDKTQEQQEEVASPDEQVKQGNGAAPAASAPTRRQSTIQGEPAGATAQEQAAALAGDGAGPVVRRRRRVAN
jgi:hypothetical protein